MNLEKQEHYLNLRTQVVKYLTVIFPKIRDQHVFEDIADNLLKDDTYIENNLLFKRAKYDALSYLRKNNRREEIISITSNDESLEYCTKQMFSEREDDIESFVKQESQKQLIEDLLKDEDELTVLCVEAYLTLDKATYRSVASYINENHADIIDKEISHKIVYRLIKQLRDNFDERKFGAYSDYLTA